MKVLYISGNHYNGQYDVTVARGLGNLAIYDCIIAEPAFLSDIDYRTLVESDKTFYITNGNIDNLIESLSENLTSHLHNIIIKDPLYMLSSEIARNVNHYIFNLMTSFVLQLEMLGMEELSNDAKETLRDIKVSVNKTINSMEILRKLKKCSIDSLSIHTLHDDIQNEIVLIKDYLNVRNCRIDYHISDNIKLNGQTCTMKTLFFNGLMFIYHSNKGCSININSSMVFSNDKTLINYDIKTDSPDNPTLSTSITDMVDAHQHIYWELINSIVSRENGTYSVENGNISHLSFEIPMRRNENE